MYKTTDVEIVVQRCVYMLFYLFSRTLSSRSTMSNLEHSITYVVLVPVLTFAVLLFIVIKLCVYISRYYCKCTGLFITVILQALKDIITEVNL